MPFDPALVRASFALVEPHAASAAAYFYGRLFAENAQLRALFPPIMDVQRDRLFAALAQVVELMDRPTQLGAYLRQLGRDHRKFGVAAEHYTSVGRALIATVRRYALPVWDSATEAAWVDGYTAAANVMIEAAAQEETPPWWTGEVVAHERRTPEVAVISLRTRRRLPYQPGQYVSVQTPYWPRVWRNYSIANAPRGEHHMQLHVRAVPGGLVSNTLVKQTNVGDALLLGPAVGTMLPPTSGRDLLLVAGGTGLAPLKAIVEHVLASPERPCISLVYGARSIPDLYDSPGLLVLASRHPGLRLFPVVSPEIVEVLGGFPSWREHEAYVCGPSRMVESTVRFLLSDGMPASRVHHDLRLPVRQSRGVPEARVW